MDARARVRGVGDHASLAAVASVRAGDAVLALQAAGLVRHTLAVDGEREAQVAHRAEGGGRLRHLQAVGHIGGGRRAAFAFCEGRRVGTRVGEAMPAPCLLRASRVGVAALRFEVLTTSAVKQTIAMAASA